VLARLVESIEPWLRLAQQREHAIASALQSRRARLAATMLQAGLFDRRADRTAVAQSALVDEALHQLAQRGEWLDRLRRLQMDERAFAFAIIFR
jgi:hypothetical protein